MMMAGRVLGLHPNPDGAQEDTLRVRCHKGNQKKCGQSEPSEVHALPAC